MPLSPSRARARARARAVIEAVGDAEVIAELGLRQIAVEVLFAAVLVHAAHAALEDGERALGVGVDRRALRIDVAQLRAFLGRN